MLFTTICGAIGLFISFGRMFQMIRLTDLYWDAAQAEKKRQECLRHSEFWGAANQLALRNDAQRQLEEGGGRPNDTDWAIAVGCAILSTALILLAVLWL